MNRGERSHSRRAVARPGPGLFAFSCSMLSLTSRGSLGVEVATRGAPETRHEDAMKLRVRSEARFEREVHELAALALVRCLGQLEKAIEPEFIAVLDEGLSELRFEAATEAIRCYPEAFGQLVVRLRQIAGQELQTIRDQLRQPALNRGRCAIA